MLFYKIFFVCKVDKSREQCAYLLNTGFAGFARDRAENKELWTQDRGPRTQDPGPRTQDPGPRTQDPGPRTQDPGPRTQDPGPRTQDPGPRNLPMTQDLQ